MVEKNLGKEDQGYKKEWREMREVGIKESKDSKLIRFRKKIFELRKKDKQ